MQVKASLPAEGRRHPRSAIARAALLSGVATLLLGGCVSRPRPIATDDRYAPLVEGPNMRVVRGENVATKPLNPEPGDVWAGIVPDRETALAEEGPPPRSAGAKRTSVGQSKEAATAITTPLEADWPVSQAAQTAAAHDLAPTPGAASKSAAGAAAGATLGATRETAPETAPGAAAAPVPATNPTRKATQGVAASAAPATTPTRAAHGREVQLAAAGSPAEAEATWARLVGRYPALLQGRSPIVRQGEAEGRTVWRLRTGGFGNAAEAKSFCDRLRGAGGTCWVAGHS